MHRLFFALLVACQGTSAQPDARSSSTDGAPHTADAPHGQSDAPQHVTTYALDTIDGSCDTLSSPQVLPILGLFHATDVYNLPAPFPFFDTMRTRFAVGDQGILELFDSSNVNLTTLVEPVMIPDAAAPNGFIAPLWMYHLTYVPDRSAFNAAIVGADHHTVIEWNDFAIGFVADQTSHMTMQAKLFGDGHIELHYCTLTPGNQPASDASGDAASIGIESPDGTAGVSAGYRTAGMATTAHAFRFTPN